MKRVLSSGSALLIFAVAAPVSALAPTDQYEKYVFETETIVDLHTKLEWDRYRDGVPYPAEANWSKAKADCEAVGKRLPTLKELLTIVDESPYNTYVVDHNEPRYIDSSAFPKSPDQPFWTSSIVTDNTTKVYVVDFRLGVVDDAFKSDTRRVRCVK